MFPIRGQVICVEKIPGFNDSIVHEDSITYLITRNNDCLIGGTADDGDWELNPTETIKQSILTRVTNIFPQFNSLNIIKDKVGLRPGRPSVRLELEQSGDNIIIHNYGHGGAGVTLSWGCATEVVKLVKDL